jgi:nucleotide-binding universal stress UspA family protein
VAGRLAADFRVLSQAAAFSADLVVVGAYGRSHLRE